MPDAALQPVIEAIKAGDRQQARRLLRPLLRQPTADRWYVAALLSGSSGAARTSLQRALELDPQHEKARQRLAQLAGEEQPEFSEADMPSLTDLVADEVVLPTEKPVDLYHARVELDQRLRQQPFKQPPRRRRRSRWLYVSLGSGLLLSLSLSYFALMALGSGLPGQIRGLITGNRPVVLEAGATPVYATPVAVVDGTPYYVRPLSEIGDAGATPVREINGTPVFALPDAVIVVEPSKSQELVEQQPVSDILEPGFAHEYVFSGFQGQELAIGVQFFSPTANRVNRNVVILDPDEFSAERLCERDRILEGDNGVAFICQINKTGQWKLRLFGREGESSGAYVVALEVFG